MNPLKDWKPVGENCLIERSPENNARGVIDLPDGAQQATSIARLLSVGPKAKLPKLLPEETIITAGKAKNKRKINLEYPYDNCDFVNYKEIYAVLRNGIVIPLGKNFLVHRLNEEYQTAGGIIVPGAQPTTDQTLWVKFVRRGILREGERWTVPVLPGDVCKLQEWQAEFTEIELLNGDYSLIVPENALEYIDNEHPSVQTASGQSKALL